MLESLEDQRSVNNDEKAVVLVVASRNAWDRCTHKAMYCLVAAPDMGLRDSDHRMGRAALVLVLVAEKLMISSCCGCWCHGAATYVTLERYNENSRWVVLCDLTRWEKRAQIDLIIRKNNRSSST